MLYSRFASWLGRPALHVVFGVLFAGAFVWPLLAVEHPRSTWMFLQGAWLLAIVALYAVSRGVDPKADDEEGDAGDGVESSAKVEENS